MTSNPSIMSRKKGSMTIPKNSHANVVENSTPFFSFSLGLERRVLGFDIFVGLQRRFLVNFITSQIHRGQICIFKD